MSEQAKKDPRRGTTEEQMALLYPKTFPCPVCGKDFINFIVRKTKLRTLNIETDFKTNFYTIDPNKYEVLLCSYCGYAALQAYFDRISDKQQALIIQKIKPAHKYKEYSMPLTDEDALERYMQAAKCAAAIGAKAGQRAIISLKAAWLFRDMGDKQKELACLNEAYIGLKEAYSTESFPIGAMDEQTTQFMIAELARRIGDFGEALKWISSVVVAKGIPSSLKERAQIIKDLIRDRNSN